MRWNGLFKLDIERINTLEGLETDVTLTLGNP